MESINLNIEQNYCINEEVSRIINMYINNECIECIFMSIYKDIFKKGIKHIDICLIPFTEEQSQTLKTLVDNSKKEEIYKKTDFVLTVFVENPNDYKDVKLFNIDKIRKIINLYNSEIILDRNEKYNSLIKEYEFSLDECINMLEIKPKIKIKVV